MNYLFFRELRVNISIDIDVIDKNHFRKSDFSIESYFQRIAIQHFELNRNKSKLQIGSIEDLIYHFLTSSVLSYCSNHRLFLLLLFLTYSFWLKHGEWYSVLSYSGNGNENMRSFRGWINRYNTWIMIQPFKNSLRTKVFLNFIIFFIFHIASFPLDLIFQNFSGV